MKRHIYLITIVIAANGAASLWADDKQGTSDSSVQSSSQNAQQDTSQQTGEIQSEAAGAGKSGTKVTMDQLPQPVQKTIKAHAEGFNVENLQKKIIKGQTVYTGSFDKGNMRTELTVGDDGSLLQFQQSEQLAIGAAVPEIGQTAIQMNELPKPVQQTIKQRAKQQKVGNITKTSHEPTTIYHAAFNEGGVHTDLFVSEDGKIVAETQQTALYVAPLESSQKVSLNTAPQAVQRTIREQAGSSRITDIDKGKWQGQTAYKIMVEKNGKPTPLVISESGQLLGGTISEAAGAQQPQEQSDAPSQNEQNKD